MPFGQNDYHWIQNTTLYIYKDNGKGKRPLYSTTLRIAL